MAAPKAAICINKQNQVNVGEMQRECHIIRNYLNHL